MDLILKQRFIGASIVLDIVLHVPLHSVCIADKYNQAAVINVFVRFDHKVKRRERVWVDNLLLRISYFV